MNPRQRLLDKLSTPGMASDVALIAFDSGRRVLGRALVLHEEALRLEPEEYPALRLYLAARRDELLDAVLDEDITAVLAEVFHE
jgi:hypothetical protein